MSSDEIQEGVNDFSIISSARLNQTWLMLGPISFVNASCNANIEYSREGFSVQAVVKKDIKVDEEISVFYDRHFFGDFNVNCLCPFSEKHGHPFPELSNVRRKRKRNVCEPIESTPKVSNTRIVRNHFPVVDPMHRFGYSNMEEMESSESDSESILDYETGFGTIDRRCFEEISSIHVTHQISDGTIASLEKESPKSSL